jgi:hypothetical protein
VLLSSANDVPLLADLGFCRVQSHANPHVGSIGQFVGCKLPLSHDSGGQRRVRAVESKEEGIALRVDLASAAAERSFPDERPRSRPNQPRKATSGREI